MAECGVGVGVSVLWERCLEGVRDLPVLAGTFNLPCPSGFRILLQRESYVSFPSHGSFSAISPTYVCKLGSL